MVTCRPSGHAPSPEDQLPINWKRRVVRTLSLHQLSPPTASQPHRVDPKEMRNGNASF